MKLRNLLFVGLLALGLAFNPIDADAQKVTKRYHQSISANPVGLIFGILNATYEQQISAKNTFTVNGLYWSIGNWTAFGIGGSYRWYILESETNKKPIEGLSVGPTISFSSWSFDTDFGSLDVDEGLNVALGGEVAYKWVFGSGFTVEPILSFSFGVTGVGDLTPFGAGVNLGYAW